MKKLETELKSYFDTKHCFLVSSGKAALTLILESLQDISPGKDEVLIPAFTCFSVPAAIRKAGLHIKLCDMGADSLDFDQKTLGNIAEEEQQEKKLLCVIPTHLFGFPADVESCRNVFADDVIIVEDAAQAMGNEMQGKKLGTIGDIGFFSLGRGKPLSTMEGGIIVTNRDDLAQAIKKRIQSLPEYGTIDKFQLFIKALLTTLLQNPSLFWLPKSLPFLHLGETIYDPDFTIKKLSSLHAALAHNWQSRLTRHQGIRKSNVSRFLNFDQSEPKSIFHSSPADAPSLIRLPIMVKDRATANEIINSASRQGLGIMPTYPAPISEISEIKDFFHGEHYPRAKRLSDQLATVPTHEYMEKKDYKNIHTLFDTNFPTSEQEKFFRRLS